MLENTVSVKVIVMKTVVSEKGQVTIPRKIRQRLGIFPGTVIEFEAQGGRLIGKKPIARTIRSYLLPALSKVHPI
jgi:AbrB family looped-hinge helix DNA binding protein